jgi:hypothetical protein
MRRRAFIGIALLALSFSAFAHVSSALAQAGSTGGTIGKTEKSISGSEDTDRPRAAPLAKRPAAKEQETSSGGSCGRIVGRWSWYLNLTESVFHKDGTAGHSSGATGRWSCTGGTVSVVWGDWGNARTDRIAVSPDGNTISVDSPWGGGIRFKGRRRGQD